MAPILMMIAVVLLTASCSRSEAPGDAPLPGGRNTAKTESQGDVALTGAGATFPYPLYTKWVAAFQQTHPKAKINYQSIGSGGGIRQITERTVDFGASDAPMSDEQMGKAPGIVHIPTCLGAVALIYNIEGVPAGLKVTPDAMAGIFLGKIKKWNDPALTAENPDAKLPDKEIATVHRSDGSGTTKIFVDYLSAISADWKSGPGTGTSVNWPSGLGGKGNEGVSALVSSTPSSVGYVELAYAVQNKLAFAAIKNRSGKFVSPSIESTTAAGAGASATMPDDLRVSIVNAEGDDAYPISGFTYILVYEEQKDREKGKVLADFLSWAVHEGQKFTKDLHYAPLPSSVVEQVDKKLALLKGPDQKAFLKQ